MSAICLAATAAQGQVLRLPRAELWPFGWRQSWMAQLGMLRKPAAPGHTTNVRLPIPGMPPLPRHAATATPVRSPAQRQHAVLMSMRLILDTPCLGFLIIADNISCYEYTFQYAKGCERKVRQRLAVSIPLVETCRLRPVGVNELRRARPLQHHQRRRRPRRARMGRRQRVRTEKTRRQRRGRARRRPRRWRRPRARRRRPRQRNTGASQSQRRAASPGRISRHASLPCIDFYGFGRGSRVL